MHPNFPMIRNVLLVYAALLPIVNPFGMAPIFAAMLFPYEVAVRRAVAMKVALNGLVLLLASVFIGSYVLDFFGISIGAVQLGGGMVVMISGWRILNEQTSVSDRELDPPPNSAAILSKAFYPLTMPLTVGPGSIAVALTLGSNFHVTSHLQRLESAVASTLGVTLIAVTIYLCYRFSDSLERFLGNTGTSILVRLTAFILVCIGIQIMFNGVNQFYSEILQATRDAAAGN